MHTAEEFKAYEIAGIHNGLNLVVTPGVKHTLSVPDRLPTRHVWIAAGAYRQPVDADHWWIQGRLTFWLSGSQVGFMHFCDASSSIAAAERTLANRTIVGSSAPGGGTQPALRYSEISAGAVRMYLDIPCQTLSVVCDKVQYEVDSSYDFVTGAGTTLGLLTGLRITSTR